MKRIEIQYCKNPQKKIKNRKKIMKPTQQQKDNKLIAEFMGLTIITDNISYFDTNYKPLKNYHNDWNWLMEVVEKIEPLISESEFKYRIGNDLLSVNKEGVYNACIEFIVWYNENKI